MEAENEEAVWAAHEEVVQRVLYTSGNRYVGRFIGSLEKEEEWIKPHEET